MASIENVPLIRDILNIINEYGIYLHRTPIHKLMKYLRVQEMPQAAKIFAQQGKIEKLNIVNELYCSLSVRHINAEVVQDAMTARTLHEIYSICRSDFCYHFYEAFSKVPIESNVIPSNPFPKNDTYDVSYINELIKLKDAPRVIFLKTILKKFAYIRKDKDKDKNFDVLELIFDFEHIGLDRHEVKQTLYRDSDLFSPHRKTRLVHDMHINSCGLICDKKWIRNINKDPRDEDHWVFITLNTTDDPRIMNMLDNIVRNYIGD